MRELRYSEGKEVTVEYRFAGGRPGELPRLARELADAKVDVIMAIGDEAIVAAKNATRAVPIVTVACDAVTTAAACPTPAMVTPSRPCFAQVSPASHLPRSRPSASA
jgi:ABC-type uncharacterized transport system substrate-binding protein